ncbi:MAG TPA: carbohydrate ABC transporter permease [Armatimonadota bacterium]|nr:carbohydrate ABC transporter permease [Armatimonadota bacterium]
MAGSRKPQIKMTTPGRFVTYCALVALSVVFFMPFIWLLSTSVKPDSQIMVMPPRWIPHPFQWSNYSKGLTFVNFPLFLRNTLIICSANVIGVLVSSPLVAYGLSMIRWRGRDILFMVILSTMILPYQVVMVPLFTVFTFLRWTGTFLPLIVPAFLGNAFFIFLLRQFLMTIPRDLIDAAKIDGCSEFQIYHRIVLPLAKPVLATVALFAFMWSWNDFLGPLIYLFDESMYTISLGLAMFSSQYGSYWGMLMAVSTVTTVPIIILFFFTQRTFIQGITLTGIKG